jgi:hypothetical protein
LIQTSETLAAIHLSEVPLVVHDSSTGTPAMWAWLIGHLSVFRLQLEHQHVVMPFLS